MDTLSSERRRALMLSIRSGDTACEMLVRRFLFSKGFRFRIHDKRLAGKPDLVLAKYKTVVFIHGCFWHGHADCRYWHEPRSNITFWREKVLRNSVRDARDIARLEQAGWNVIVLWECELRSKRIRPAVLDGLANEIQEQGRAAMAEHQAKP